MASSINSPCAQIDFIKGQASALKVETQAGGAKLAQVSDKLTQVDTAIKTGDPKKAQQAFDTAKATYEKAETQSDNSSPKVIAQTHRQLQAYA